MLTIACFLHMSMSTRKSTARPQDAKTSGVHRPRALHTACALESRAYMYKAVIRVRPDLYLPFRLVSVPELKAAFVGFVGAPTSDCAAWVDDRFAILTTRLAWIAYMRGYSQQFCRTKRLAPECKVGNALAVQSVPAVDIRPLLNNTGLQIVRGHCRRETAGMWWVTPYNNNTTFVLSARQLHRAASGANRFTSTT